MRLGSHLVVSLFVMTLTTSVCRAQEQANATESSMVVNGVRVHYRVIGRGPPLMLLHGYLWTGEAWAPFVSELSKDFTLIIPDMRGHGKSGVPSGQFLLRDTARDYFALADHLKLERFAAVGHSAGANALYYMAVEQPDRITALVAVGARHAFTDAGRRAMRGHPPYDSLPPQYRSLFDRVHVQGRPQIDWLIREFRRLGATDDDLNLTPAKLKRIRARTLIVAGDREELDVSLTEMRAIPGSSLWVVPSAGHFPVWSDWGGSRAAAQVFGSTVREFVNGTSSVRK